MKPLATKHIAKTPAAKNVVSSESRLLHWTARILTIIVAGSAAILSFDALTQLAVAAGVTGALAWIWAVVVDGFILIATISVFALRKRGRKALIWPFVILGLFVLISIIGNGLHPILRADELQLSGTPDFGGKLPFWAATIVTAIPPIALFLAIHLLTVMVTPSENQEKQIAKEEKAAERVQQKLQQETDKLKVETTSEPVLAPYSAPILPVPKTPVLANRADSPKPISFSKEEKEILAEVESEPNVVAQEGTAVVRFEQSVQKAEPSDAEKELTGKLLAGINVTGQEAADLYGVSLRTGQNKLKKIRQELGLA